MKRIISIILALVCLLSMAVPALAAESFEEVANSVVRVYTEDTVTYYYTSSGTAFDREVNRAIGTAFAIGKPGEPVKYFLTNNHVAEQPYKEYLYMDGTDEAGNPVKTQITAIHEPVHYLVFTELENKIPVNIVANSDRADMAILGLNQPTTERVACKIRTFKGIEELGHAVVYAVGFPGVADQANANLYSWDFLNSYPSDMTFTQGLVNNLKEDAVTEMGETIQHTAKISGGNSGGPLVDENGYVVGINHSHWTSDGGDYCMAASSNEIVRFLEDERIEFTLAEDAKKAETMRLAIIIGGAVLAIAIIAVVIIVVTSKKKKNTATRSLYCDAGSLLGRKYPLKGKIGVGHDNSRCQIVFPSNAPGVSGLHCTITFDGKEVRVTDENSRYGTWIDENRLQPGVATVMHRGQKLYLGSKKQVMSLHN